MTTPSAAWVALCLVPGIGGKTLTHLLEAFGTAEAVLSAPDKALRRIKGIGPALCKGIRRADPARTAADLEHWGQAGVQVLGWESPGYPALLRHAPDAPPLLFVRGALPTVWPQALAVVGTRTPTESALAYARRAAARAVEAGQLVVSGLALGIDSAAHQAALDAGGQTVAVLGGGVLMPYPSESRPLAERILAAGGALLCEVNPTAPAYAPALIARNRIITGLSHAVLVVQSNHDGGAMHAARFAAAQGRSLYTPGEAFGDPSAIESVAGLLALGARVWGSA